MNNRTRTILVLLILTGIAASGFSFPQEGFANHEDSDSVLHQQVLFNILDLRFEQADSLLALAAEKNRENPETSYLENYLEFLDALVSGDLNSFRDYQEASGRRIESIRNGRKEHPGSLLALSTIHLQSSVLCAFHNEMFKAARHLYYSNRYLKQGEEIEVGNLRKFRNRGLLILISASVPEEYHWLLKVFGLKGGIEEGFGYLEEYYTFAVGAERIEAYLLLDYAGNTLQQNISDPVTPFRYENTRVPGRHMDAVTPGNRAKTLNLYSKALADLGSGNSHRVIINLQNYKQDPRERELPYLDLILGEALLNRLNPLAEESLMKFTRKNTGLHYRHFAWHKLSWSYALKGDWENYGEARQQVMDAGEPYLDSDRQALSEASDTLPLNLTLLKARLLFDGGDYTGALEILDDSSGIVLHNERDSLESIYRKARILDKSGDQRGSIDLYKKVIATGSDQSWFFAPNAALQLGMIYEREGDTEKAIRYYRKCLKINKSSYKQSIDNKARAGIRRCDK